MPPAQLSVADLPHHLPSSLVRDFAYPHFHPLHAGPLPPDASPALSQFSNSQSYSHDSQQDSDASGDGPPFAEDEYLASPVISTAAGGEREYYFSVASSEDEIHGRALALFDFVPENDNEVPLKEGQIIWISYRHGQGWLVAQDPATGESGLVPEEYVEIIQRDAFQADEDMAQHADVIRQGSATSAAPDATGISSKIARSHDGADEDTWEDIEE
ncbi:uncharacterized protein V2V93DRAFT_367193 [Kockiozyma suomiensis]|uniref:uncharacterized protein n=1 Tax=Kockiozyma suomiensis TaxID=1337062 RepID=UPI0033432629